MDSECGTFTSHPVAPVGFGNPYQEFQAGLAIGIGLCLLALLLWLVLTSGKKRSY